MKSERTREGRRSRGAEEWRDRGSQEETKRRRIEGSGSEDRPFVPFQGSDFRARCRRFCDRDGEGWFSVVLLNQQMQPVCGFLDLTCFITSCVTDILELLWLKVFK